jgi:hypothetical protein
LMVVVFIFFVLFFSLLQGWDRHWKILRDGE